MDYVVIYKRIGKDGYYIRLIDNRLPYENKRFIINNTYLNPLEAYIALELKKYELEFKSNLKNANIMFFTSRKQPPLEKIINNIEEIANIYVGKIYDKS